MRVVASLELESVRDPKPEGRRCVCLNFGLDIFGRLAAYLLPSLNSVATFLEIREKSGKSKVVREVREKHTLLTEVREKQELGDIFLKLCHEVIFFYFFFAARCQCFEYCACADGTVIISCSFVRTSSNGCYGCIQHRGVVFVPRAI